MFDEYGHFVWEDLTVSIEGAGLDLLDSLELCPGIANDDPKKLKEVCETFFDLKLANKDPAMYKGFVVSKAQIGVVGKVTLRKLEVGEHGSWRIRIEETGTGDLIVSKRFDIAEVCSYKEVESFLAVALQCGNRCEAMPARVEFWEDIDNDTFPIVYSLTVQEALKWLWEKEKKVEEERGGGEQTLKKEKKEGF